MWSSIEDPIISIIWLEVKYIFTEMFITVSAWKSSNKVN